MNDEQIDKLLYRIDEIARDTRPGTYALPVYGILAPNRMRNAIRDWLLGQSEYFSELGGKLAIIIPEEWIDK